jgi:hypothetical protein
MDIQPVAQLTHRPTKDAILPRVEGSPTVFPKPLQFCYVGDLADMHHGLDVSLGTHVFGTQSPKSSVNQIWRWTLWKAIKVKLGLKGGALVQQSVAS